MFCSKCNTQLSDDAAFCSVCGKPQGKEALVDPAQLYAEGVLHYNSNTPQGYQRALELFCAAGELGHSDAMVYAGHMYVSGTGVEIDNAAAEKYFSMGALLGNPLARENLEKLHNMQANMAKRAAVKSGQADAVKPSWKGFIKPILGIVFLLLLVWSLGDNDLGRDSPIVDAINGFTTNLLYNHTPIFYLLLIAFIGFMFLVVYLLYKWIFVGYAEFLEYNYGVRLFSFLGKLMLIGVLVYTFILHFFVPSVTAGWGFFSLVDASGSSVTDIEATNRAMILILPLAGFYFLGVRVKSKSFLQALNATVIMYIAAIIGGYMGKLLGFLILLGIILYALLGASASSASSSGRTGKRCSRCGRSLQPHQSCNC
jgi:hypothetical protein